MRRVDFLSLISTEDAAIAWMREKGLLMRTAQCPICSSMMQEEYTNGADDKIWSCRRTINGRRHQIRTSIRSGSLFAGSNISIRATLLLLYEWSRLTPIDETAYQCGVGKRAALLWFSKFRDLVEFDLASRDESILGGNNEIIELDECQIGRRKQHSGRVPKPIWVFGGVVRGSGGKECFIEIVRNRKKDTLYPIIQRKINQESKIITDGAAVYRDLGEIGFSHSWVNHTENFVSPQDPSVHTQSIESLWKSLRKFLNKRTSYNRKKLSGYINEFIYRKLYCDPFDCIISAIQRKYPI